MTYSKSIKYEIIFSRIGARENAEQTNKVRRASQVCQSHFCHIGLAPALYGGLRIPLNKALQERYKEKMIKQAICENKHILYVFDHVSHTFATFQHPMEIAGKHIGDEREMPKSISDSWKLKEMNGNKNKFTKTSYAAATHECTKQKRFSYNSGASPMCQARTELTWRDRPVPLYHKPPRTDSKQSLQNMICQIVSEDHL